MKSIFSPKQRREIYLLAAIEIIENRHVLCCNAIERASNIEEIALMDFPEFELFDPKFDFFYHAWFRKYYTLDEQYSLTQTKEQRIFCLLSCAEMIRQGIKTE
jgi:hypothetical protein